MHTSGPTPQFRVCRATALIVYVFLIPFRLSQISCSTLQHPQLFPSVLKYFHGCKNLSPDSALLLAGLVFLALLLLPSFFHPTSHLICCLRNLYVGQEATVRTRHGITDWFQIGKGVHQGYILSPCLFNLYAEYIL